MKMGYLLAVVGMSTGCFVGMPQERQPAHHQPAPAEPRQAPPSARSTSGPSSPPVADDRKRACAILDRVAALKTAIDETLALDGTEAAVQVRRKMSSCQGDKIACARQLESESRTGALIGLADAVMGPVPTYLPSWKRAGFLPSDVRPITGIEKDLDVVEDQVKKAGAEAHRVADARTERQKQLDAEMPSISDAADACAKNEGACKTRCETAKDGFACLAWASKLRNSRPAKLADAKSYFGKACDAGVQHGCTAIPIISKEIQDASAMVEALWSEVQAVGDDLAVKRHQTDMVAQIANRPHLQMQAQRMRVINDAIVRERYCPAKKEFVAKAGSADFATRAAAHCREAAPEASGLSGAQITLTTQCQAAYATACP